MVEHILVPGDGTADQCFDFPGLKPGVAQALPCRSNSQSERIFRPGAHPPGMNPGEQFEVEFPRDHQTPHNFLRAQGGLGLDGSNTFDSASNHPMLIKAGRNVSAGTFFGNFWTKLMIPLTDQNPLPSFCNSRFGQLRFSSVNSL